MPTAETLFGSTETKESIVSLQRSKSMTFGKCVVTYFFFFFFFFLYFMKANRLPFYLTDFFL